MDCNRLEHYLNENEGVEIEKDSDLQKHIGECRDCKNYFLFDKIMHSQKEVFEKAPEYFLFNVRRKINDLRNHKQRRSILGIFRPLIKPAIAFASLALLIALFATIKNSPVGVVDNLVDRFNISELKNIKINDVLYVSKQIHVDLTLNGNVKVQVDSNTVLQLRAKDRIALFRGQFFLSVGSNKMTIETPNGLITLKHAKIKIQTTLHEEKGVHNAETSCCVIDGSAEIDNSKEKIAVMLGQEIVLTENGAIERKSSLPDAAKKEQASGIATASKSKVFTAKEQICDCLYDMRYNSDNNQLHGKEMKENKFPVRVFWQNSVKIESMRRPDEKFCFFNAGGSPVRYIGNSPGI